jgi:S-adenosylmethionine synthetase
VSFIIEPLGRAIATRRLEVVERKGRGHPDTLCDALADSLSLASLLP